MFIKKNKFKNLDETKKPKKLWKKIFTIVFFSIIIISASYVAYIYASGQKIFEGGNLSASPFFKKISGQQYTLKGEGDGRINILVLGMGGANHPGGQLTDSIMVVSIDPDNKNMAMLSIPRDLYIPVPGTKYSKKINEIYKIGEDKKKGYGGEFTKDAVGKILDLPMHYYVTVDFYGFKKFIDSIGGVDIYVDKELNDPMFPDANMKGYEPLRIKAGQQHMSGELALKYARSRETSSDFDRAVRQQKVIQALRQKILDLGYLTNPKKILDIVTIISDHIRTDFTQNEILSLAKMAKDLNYNETISKVLTNGVDGELISDSSAGTYTLLPKGGNWEIVQKVAHELFTDPDLRREDAKIEVVNGTNTSGLAGKLAETLKSYNYSVVSIITGKPSIKTIIYDYTNGAKPVTIKFLDNRLNVKASKVTRPAASTGIDISITIGDDYKGFSKEPTASSNSSVKNNTSRTQSSTITAD